MEEQSRERLAEAADLISKFTALAAAKGLTLGAESFEFIQTTGIVAKAPGIARTLLGPIRIEREGLMWFDEIAGRFPPDRYREGCFAGPDFDVPPVLSSAAVWSPIPQATEVGREEAVFRRTDHRVRA